MRARAHQLGVEVCRYIRWIVGWCTWSGSSELLQKILSLFLSTIAHPRSKCARAFTRTEFIAVRCSSEANLCNNIHVDEPTIYRRKRTSTRGNLNASHRCTDSPYHNHRSRRSKPQILVKHQLRINDITSRLELPRFLYRQDLNFPLNLHVRQIIINLSQIQIHLTNYL